MSNHNVEPIGKKVVQLEADAERMTRAKLARLPNVVQSVREAAQRVLAQRLKQYFERADDSLFDLADKAANNEEQNVYFDSMREVRVRRFSIETNFTSAIDEAFASIAQVSSTSGETEDVYDSLKADALSLVHDDDLEALVAVDSSVARANSEFGEPMQFLSLRLDSLVPVKVYQKNNPIGPDVICAAFMSEVKKLDVTIKAKLLLFRLFDQCVISGLGQVYREVNDILVQNNVMPSLPDGGARASKSAGGGARSVPSEGRAGSVSSDIDQEVISALGKLFGEGVISESSVKIQQDQLASNQFVRLLTAAQSMPVQSGVVVKSSDIRSTLENLRGQSAGVGFSVGTVEDQVMNLVSMLFDFILEDRNLAPAMTALISRMQIPVIKVALADKTFFTKPGHVARKLLNEMATAAIGWQADANSLERDPLYRKIDEIVRKLISEFETDISIFDELLVDFTAFLEKERRRIAILERRTVDAEDGKAKAEVARNTVAEAIKTRTKGYIWPEAVTKLLDDAWSNVLFVTALKHGYKSEEWSSSLLVVDELLWSVRAPETPSERQKLIKVVPQLLKKLRSGLDTISYNPFDISSLFKSLEAVHLDCIRGKSQVVSRADLENVAKQVSEELEAEAIAEQQAKSSEPESKPTESSAQVASENGNEEIEITGLSPYSSAAVEHNRLSSSNNLNEPSDAKPVVTEPVLEEPEPHHLQQVSGFVQGAWFDMHLDGEGSTRCRLAAYIKPTSKYIFVNRNGMKVAEKTQHELALMLKREKLRALDNSMMFDRALETIVSGIRTTRPQR